MANRYFGKCPVCGAEIVSFRSGISPCTKTGCDGRDICQFPAPNAPAGQELPPEAESGPDTKIN